MLDGLDPDQAWLFVRPDLGPHCLQRVSTDDKNRPLQDTFNANRAHANIPRMCMFFCHQVSMHNHCHLSWCRLADLSNQHLFFIIMFECFQSPEWQDLLSTFKNCENTTCLDDFDKSKPEIRPAVYVTMVVSSINCDKIVHTKMHLLSTTCQTCINAYSYASLKSNNALINWVEGTGTVNFKMLKGTIFVGYQNRKLIIYAELPNSSNLPFSQNCYLCKLMTLI